jgi:hypothetical protein
MFPYPKRRFIKDVHDYVINTLWSLANGGLEQVETFNGMNLKRDRSVIPGENIHRE